MKKKKENNSDERHSTYLTICKSFTQFQKGYRQAVLKL